MAKLFPVSKLLDTIQFAIMLKDFLEIHVLFTTRKFLN